MLIFKDKETFEVPTWEEYVDQAISGGGPRLFVFVTPWLREACSQGIISGYVLHNRDVNGRKVAALKRREDIYLYADICCELSSIKNRPVEVGVIDRYQARFRAFEEPPIKLERTLFAAGGSFLAVPSKNEWERRFEASRKRTL